MVSKGIQINYMFQPVLMRMALWNLFVSATVLVISVIVANAFMTISIFIGIIIALINLAILAKTVKSGFLFRPDKAQRFVMKRYYMRLIATMLYIILALGLFSYLISRRLEIVPDNIQSVAELLVEGIKGLVEETMGHHGSKYFPLIATFGIYILISNLLGLIPGFLPPTSNLNTTAGLAIIVFFATHIIGIKEHGIKYLKHFIGPIEGLPIILMIIMAPLMIFVESISHLVRPVSLSLRLFGNIKIGRASCRER